MIRVGALSEKIWLLILWILSDTTIPEFENLYFKWLYVSLIFFFDDEYVWVRFRIIGFVVYVASELFWRIKNRLICKKINVNNVKYI